MAFMTASEVDEIFIHLMARLVSAGVAATAAYDALLQTWARALTVKEWRKAAEARL